MFLILVALLLLIGTGGGVLWWRFGPGWGSAPHPSVQRFDHTFGSPLRPPPRPDEGLSWAEAEEDSDGWERALKGLALVVAIGVAGAALAAGLFVAGRFLVHEVSNYFGTTGL